MDRIILQEVNEQYINGLEDFRNELILSGDLMEGCGDLKELSARAWVARCLSIRNPATCPDGHVITTQFVCLRAKDQKLVGIIKVRHTLTEFLEKYVGHIGYSVRPSERRKGYGTQMLKAVLPYCKEIGLARVLVCCMIGNSASQKTILSAGGIFEKQDYSPSEGIYLERYWIET